MPTSTPKVVGLTRSCGECPNYGYYSGGVSRCNLVEENVYDKSIVAPFCPLPDYPSQIIAGMQMTILGLRELHKYGFGLTLMTHIATKLKLNLHGNGMGLTIPFKDGKKDREVYLGQDYIRTITQRPFEVTFMGGETTFSLFPDDEPPLLREATDSTGQLWRHFELR